MALAETAPQTGGDRRSHHTTCRRTNLPQPLLCKEGSCPLHAPLRICVPTSAYIRRWNVIAATALLAVAGCNSNQSPTTSQETSTGGTTASTQTGQKRGELEVGFLPVTCHLTCPVTDFATRTSGKNRFVSKRFSDFPTVVETIKSERMLATFMIAPLAMKLREQGVPVKICYLGHRDGSTVMVAKDSPAKSLRDLKGKKFAIPSKYSNQYLVISKLMQD
ncbi:MAG: ABC transporter substrate-binding protein, partial [Armatimonadota bacterium]|nr:ABC transporter substrate-binding protein [Armatimonadota bacterium]